MKKKGLRKKEWQYTKGTEEVRRWRKGDERQQREVRTIDEGGVRFLRAIPVSKRWIWPIIVAASLAQ